MTIQEMMRAFFQTKRRHPKDAYAFLYETIDWVVLQITQGKEKKRHISGKELSLGFRDRAIEQFGCMARTVLETWNIHSTENIGEMVFDLVNVEIMRLSEGDRRSDFNDIFDFETEFDIRPIVESYVPGKKEWVIKYKKTNTFPERN